MGILNWAIQWKKLKVDDWQSSEKDFPTCPPWQYHLQVSDMILLMLINTGGGGDADAEVWLMSRKG